MEWYSGVDQRTGLVHSFIFCNHLVHSCNRDIMQRKINKRRIKAVQMFIILFQQQDSVLGLLMVPAKHHDAHQNTQTHIWSDTCMYTCALHAHAHMSFLRWGGGSGKAGTPCAVHFVPISLCIGLHVSCFTAIYWWFHDSWIYTARHQVSWPTFLIYSICCSTGPAMSEHWFLCNSS